MIATYEEAKTFIRERLESVENGYADNLFSQLDKDPQKTLDMLHAMFNERLPICNDDRYSHRRLEDNLSEDNASLVKQANQVINEYNRRVCTKVNYGLMAWYLETAEISDSLVRGAFTTFIDGAIDVGHYQLNHYSLDTIQRDTEALVLFSREFVSKT